jgi:16S rRNA (guanine527-N7)-methyltransferase
MTGAEVKAWIADRYGADGAARVGDAVALILDEAGRQNLIAPSTVPDVWNRHVLDSLQLAPLAGSIDHWADIGTGGGFPGLVIAAATGCAMTLIEPRKLRAAFLARATTALGLPGVTVAAAKVERVSGAFDIFSARAVAGIATLLGSSIHCARADSRWLLLRGRYDAQEIRSLERDWRFMFHVEQSLSDPESSIVILSEVRRR